ncbi:hypothetical protein Pla108_40670 [Botrimarina colliarenosi]|uniref:Uncharacterized protein n=1 Tax=Botrimarina colliarenosi TaxID=2528001 RepID=A0A5C6A0T1_9BACT|nr:hypothetical protein [Botrimarina colliarenosi]TWT92927.1 hypothetical protein Pla108_40670 [Botrimarina colliarenosi]
MTVGRRGKGTKVMGFADGNGISYRGADSTPLCKRFAERGIELVYPHRNGHVGKNAQDGRRLRR